MRKITTALLSATVLMSTPALADDGEFYIGLGAGVMDAEDTDFGTGLGTAAFDEATLEGDYGWTGEAVLGYDAGIIRFEVEGAYQNFDADSLNTRTLGTVRSIPTDVVFGPLSPVGGEGEIYSGMLNALLDFGGNDGIGFAIGGGVGVSSASFDDVRAFGSGPGFLDDTDTRFAWQAIAQLYAPLNDDIDVSLKYKFHNINGGTFVDQTDRAFDASVRTHSVLGTLMFSFGGEAPPPPPLPPAPPEPVTIPQPPEPPTPPPPPPCNTGPYIVFFDFDQSDITPEAATVLNSAVSAYGNCGSARVMLAGHTDRSGSVTYNEALAGRRNASVQSYLSGRGIPAARIATEAFGESMPRVATADGVRELQNRRVEVTYGPGSGM